MADTLEKLLRDRHIRPSELARSAGLKYSSTIANWLSGEIFAPYRPNVEKVAAALRITPDELFVLIEEQYYEKHPGKRPKDQPHPKQLAPAA